MQSIEHLLTQHFKQLKIKKGDNVLIFTKLSSFGIINKKFHKIFVDFIIKYIGPNGTIAIPSYTFEDDNYVFKLNTLKSNYSTSVVTKEFFKKNIIRTKRMIHSHLFFGKKKKLFRNKIDPSISLGENSDFDLMTKHNFKNVFLGCSIKEGGTFLVHLEYLNKVPYRKKIILKKKFSDGNKTSIINVKYFHRPKFLKYDFDKTFREIIKIGAPVCIAKLRFGKSYSIKMKDFLLYGNKLFKKNINVMIEND